MRHMLQFKIHCLLVAFVDIGFELDESFHSFSPTIQTSSENRSVPLHIINIVQHRQITMQTIG